MLYKYNLFYLMSKSHTARNLFAQQSQPTVLHILYSNMYSRTYTVEYISCGTVCTSFIDTAVLTRNGIFKNSQCAIVLSRDPMLSTAPSTLITNIFKCRRPIQF